MMKSRFAIILAFLMQGLTSNTIVGQAINATDIVRKADEKFNGEKSSISTMVNDYCKTDMGEDS